MWKVHFRIVRWCILKFFWNWQRRQMGAQKYSFDPEGILGSFPLMSWTLPCREGMVSDSGWVGSTNMLSRRPRHLPEKTGSQMRQSRPASIRVTNLSWSTVGLDFDKLSTTRTRCLAQTVYFLKSLKMTNDLWQTFSSTVQSGSNMHPRMQCNFGSLKCVQWFSKFQIPEQSHRFRKFHDKLSTTKTPCLG